MSVRAEGFARQHHSFHGVFGLSPHFLLAVVSIVACVMLTATAIRAETPKRLVVAHSANWIPYAFLNEKGEPEGLMIDLWRLFGKKNDVEITFKLVDWPDTFELVRRGEADVHGGLAITETQTDFLDFSREVARIRTFLFVPIAADDEELTEMGNKPVGVVASTFDQEFIDNYFPNVNLRAYPNSEMMVQAALRGEIHAFVADYPSGYYRLILDDAIDQFRAVNALYTEGIHVAVRQGEAGLLAFLDAGFEKITESEKEKIRDRWLIPAEPMPGWVWPTIIAASSTIVLIALGLHYISLQGTVRRRTLDLRASIRELEAANCKLERLARFDSLTGVGNRQLFYERAALEIERAKRYGRPLAIALFDLDHFKQVNDRFGHVVGDEVLTAFAHALGARLRESDILVRLGGDEFVALLPETSRDTAAFLALRILNELRDWSFDHAGETIFVGFSAGIAQFEGDGSIDEWIRRADTGLYRSKREGRAMVTCG